MENKLGLPIEKNKLSAELAISHESNELSLVVLNGEDKGKSYNISKKSRFVIGRGKNCDIVLNDTKSSREHAEIVFANGNYIITDLKSQNGILVNQQKTLQSVLIIDDKIVIGQTWMKLTEDTAHGKTNKHVKEKPVKKKTNKFVFYVLLVLFAFLMFVIPDNKTNTAKRKDSSQTTKKFSEVNSELVNKIADQQKQGDKELQKNIDTIIKRGLRELREKNYYRATLEFTHALDLSPKDSQASFYLRRTYDELDQVIKELSLAAMRDIESLHYQRAIISYCAIIRLLYNFKQDKRYKETTDRINEVELKMGKEKGETSC